MKILVAEPLAKQGIEILRAHHEVDEKIGLSPKSSPPSSASTTPSWCAVRSRLRRDPGPRHAHDRDRRAGVGVDNVDLEAATRPASWSSTPDRQHHLGRRADDRPDAGARPQDRGRGRLDAKGRMEAELLHRRRAARPHPRHHRPGQDRPGRGRPRPRPRDEHHRLRPLCDRDQAPCTASTWSTSKRSSRRPTLSPSTCRSTRRRGE